MGLTEELLGCPLDHLVRSFWAVKLSTGEWVSEARVKFDIYTGEYRYFDWSNDLVATGDVKKIKEIWLFCPPGKHAPMGNTAHIPIIEPGTAFQFKVGMVDSNIVVSSKSVQAHVIGRIDNKETGDCTCFIYDPIEDGLLTPETEIYDKNNTESGFRRLNQDGSIATVGKTNITRFHSWRESLGFVGNVEFQNLGIKL